MCDRARNSTRRQVCRTAAITLGALSLPNRLMATAPPTSSSSPLWLWHPQTAGDDRSADEDYFQHHVRQIADADLFDSLQLDLPELSRVHDAAARADYPAAY